MEPINQGVNFYCNLLIRGVSIPSINIVHLVVREWMFDIVPRLELIITDDGTLSELFPLRDAEEISIELRKHEDDKKPYKEIFQLLAYKMTSSQGTKINHFHIVGMLKLNDFYFPARTRSFKHQSSIDVLEKITREAGAKLNRKIKTNDVMTWLQVNQNNFTMVKHIRKRAFIADDTPMYYYDDGAFIVTSIRSIKSSNKRRNAEFDLVNFSSESFDNKFDEEKVWFSNWGISDFSSYSNLKKNYGLAYGYFDLSDDLLKNGNQTRTQNKSILLGKNSLRRNVDGIVDQTNMGFLSSNMHNHYFDAVINNDYFRSSFFANYLLELNVNALAKPVLSEIINVLIPSNISGNYNEALSGEYCLIGKVHEIVQGEPYRLSLLLARNGVGELVADKMLRKNI